MAIHLSKELERFVQDAVRSGRYAGEADVIQDALLRLKQTMSEGIQQARKKTEVATRARQEKQPLTKDEFHRHLLELGLMSQLPDTDADFEDPADQPITIQGEPLSETIIRERAAEMADYFLDSSALVKRHVTEAGSAWIRALGRAKTAHTLYIARITSVEVYSAITRRQRGGHLSPAQADAILGHFRRHLAQRYHVMDMTPVLFTEAMLTARKYGLRAYDAVQLAVALDLNQRHHTAGFGPVTLVSADRELNDAAVAAGLVVDDPNAYP